MSTELCTSLPVALAIRVNNVASVKQIVRTSIDIDYFLAFIVSDPSTYFVLLVLSYSGMKGSSIQYYYAVLGGLSLSSH